MSKHMGVNEGVESLGLQILQRYYTKPDGYHIGADHDIFYAYATDRPIAEPDLDHLYELGWHQPEVEDGENDEHGPYEAEEGWAAYT